MKTTKDKANEEIKTPSESFHQKAAVKHYKLALHADVYKAICDIADEEHVTILEVLKRFIRYGLLIQAWKKEGARLVLQQGDKEREITL